MLKDVFKKYFGENSEEITDKIAGSLMDGYVDIKAYRNTENGKKLVYHDTGDNVVTNWMRHAIMMLLTGYSFSNCGNNQPGPGPITANNIEADASPAFSKYNESGHGADANIDGYIFNGEQYLADAKSQIEPIMSANSANIYPYYPTKVLLGTGKEYASWEDLKQETQTEFTSWFTNIEAEYGGELAAATNFNELAKSNINKYSGTVGIDGVSTGDNSLLQTITVNDPNDIAGSSSTSDMASRYGVIGAVKTLFLPNSSQKTQFESKYLESSSSDAGRLIVSNKRGAGRPCFIYFNKTNGNTPDWDDSNGAQVFLSKDATNSKILNRITFRITMPSQDAGSGSTGAYYPYNGYTLKQIGLFNDAKITTVVDANDADGYEGVAQSNMEHGMLLAIKNIEAFTKTADEQIVLTWTLTI